ncbi:MAG: cox cluster protein [Halolamina sp.]
MDENPGLSEQYRQASPWPPFVALGLPVAELGVLFGIFPVTVGGLLLFAGSIAGMLRESEYVASPWRALGAIGVPLALAGAWLAYGGAGFVTRGQAILVAAGLMLVAGVGGELFSLGRREPTV